MGKRYITQEALPEKGWKKKEREERDKKKDSRNSYYPRKFL